MAEPDRLLDYTRTQHVLSAPRDLRILLESKQPVAAEAAQDDIAAACRLTIRVTPLFGGFGEEGIDDPRFLLLRIPGVSVGELPESPFALAHDLADRLHLVSVEPDLSTFFFMEEPQEVARPASRAPCFGSSAQVRQDAAATGDAHLVPLSQARQGSLTQQVGVRLLCRNLR